MQKNVRMKFLSIVLISTMLSISGPVVRSSSAMGSTSFDRFVVQTRCPELKKYTTDETSQAAREAIELRKSHPNAKLPGMFRDYGDLRAQCRAYQE